MAAKRNSWSYEATGALIRAVAENSPHIPLLMASTSAPNEAAWKDVLKAMGEWGKGRSIQQIKGKWKALKAQFHAELARRLSSSRPGSNAPSRYRQLLRIWIKAGRPPFRSRHYTRAMAAAAAGGPQPSSQRRCQQRARSLSPLVESQPSTSEIASGVQQQPSPASVEEVGGKEEEEEEEELLQPTALSPELAKEWELWSSEKEKVAEELEEDLLQPTAISPENVEGELRSPAAWSLLPPTPVKGVGPEEESPLHPMVCHPLSPAHVESQEAVTDLGPAGQDSDHLGCQQEIRRLREELQQARMQLQQRDLQIHKQGQRLQLQDLQLRVQEHTVCQQEQQLQQLQQVIVLLQGTGDLLQSTLREQRELVTQQCELIRQLEQQPPQSLAR